MFSYLWLNLPSSSTDYLDVRLLIDFALEKREATSDDLSFPFLSQMRKILIKSYTWQDGNFLECFIIITDPELCRFSSQE